MTSTKRGELCKNTPLRVSEPKGFSHFQQAELAF